MLPSELYQSLSFSDGPDNVHIIGPNTIYLTQTLTLTCSAESTPSATYTWKLNGTEILNNSPKFTKNSAELSDSGDYICQAGNNITGKTSSVVHQLTVTGTYMVLIACIVDTFEYCS